MKETVPRTKLVKRISNSEIPSTELSLQNIANMRTERLANKTIPDQIADHPICYLNHYWPGGREAFRASQKMQMVDRFYPMAKGGALFVDEEHDKDQRDFKAKREVMQKLGHRYLVVTPTMTMMEAMEQLA